MAFGSKSSPVEATHRVAGEEPETPSLEMIVDLGEDGAERIPAGVVPLQQHNLELVKHVL